MNKSLTTIVASVLALVLGAGMTARLQVEKSRFDRTVREALRTSEGYDQIFIDMVNRLEQELATRASFGYTGGKDPMTGSKRQVVQNLPLLPEVRKDGKGAVKEASDPVKLTAIIGDPTGRKITAVVMDGERSLSVEPGDVVAGRRITRITNEGIYMESDTMIFFYDIYGKKGLRIRDGSQRPAPVAP